jgi:hypothetical protein
MKGRFSRKPLSTKKSVTPVLPAMMNALKMLGCNGYCSALLK